MKMNAKHRLSLVASLCVVTLLSACAPVQVGNDQCKDVNVNLVEITDAKYQTLPESAGGLSSAMRAAIAQTVQNWMASKPVPIAGCAIAITRDDQIAYLKAYGKADLAANRPFTIATPCPVGSISKTLTALGLLALVEDGKLELDEPLLDQMGLTPGVDVAWNHNPTLRESASRSSKVK
jgi:CubicO group peptidase (beta-lactamase class C family)